ncbi:MAG: DUF4097 family beta strand repeat protein [Oscillospiraceae bacterium]|nr:DUF4097 family beta strand repeat protein [Oscillospiraceae bacterium]
MKRNAIIRIVLWSIVIALLLGIMVSVICGGSLFRGIYSLLNNVTDTDGSGGELTLEQTPLHILPSEESLIFDPKDVEDLEIEWAAGSIILQPADVEEITITESDVSDEKYAMRWKLVNRKLTIQFSEDTIFGIGITVNTKLTKDLYIQVPRDWVCRSLEIDAASATLEVCDLTIGEVELDTASGVCRFDNCTVDSIDMDTASGDIRFSGSLNTLDFDGASAGIYAQLTNTPNRMDIDTMSGDLDLTLPADTGFIVSLDAMSGGFSSDFETTTKNGSYIHGDGRCRINVSAMSGDVIIRMGQ